MKKIKINETLAIKRYYRDSGSVDRAKYKIAQVNRWDEKSSSQRDKLYYQSANTIINQNIKINSDTVMVCLGTRNNFERDQFRCYLNHKNVFSLDIAEGSEADFIADFNDLKFDKNIDIIFSNAIDHCIYPAMSYLSWLDCLSDNGLMIVDFCVLDEECLLNEHDCSKFSRESITNFLNELESLNLIKIVYGPKSCSSKYAPFWGKEFTDGYVRTGIRKLVRY